MWQFTKRVPHDIPTTTFWSPPEYPEFLCDSLSRPRFCRSQCSRSMLCLLLSTAACERRTANGHGTELKGWGMVRIHGNLVEFVYICIWIYMNMCQLQDYFFFLWLCVLCRQFCWHQQVRSTFMKKASPYLALFNLPILKLSSSTYSVYI